MTWRKALLPVALLALSGSGCWLSDLQKNVQSAEHEEAAKEARFEQGKQRALAVRDADDAMVSGCTFLETVTGTSNVAYLYGANRIDDGLEKAAQRARLAAADLGATHVVWGGRAGGPVSNASARAYRCGAAK
jgi:hypothetical protein